MGFMRQLLVKTGIGICTAILAKGVLLFINQLGYRPELVVAHALANPTWASWCIAGLIGLASVLVYDWGARRYYAPAQRRLSSAKKKALATALGERNIPIGDITIRFASGNEECRQYADDFRDVLHRLGWNGDFGTTLDEDVELTGLRLQYDSAEPRPVCGSAVAKAFEECGIKFEWTAKPGRLVSPMILFIYRNA